MLGVRKTGWSIQGVMPRRLVSVSYVTNARLEPSYARAVGSRHGINPPARTWALPAGRLLIPQ